MIVGRYIDVDGIRTYYESDESLDAPTDVVVCIHSAGQSTTQWRYCIEALAERRVQGIALDLPGHGKSSLAPGGPIEDLRQYADFVFTFISVLGLKRPAVTGCSIGGCTALNLGVQHGEHLRSVVAAAATDHNPTVPATGLDLAAADAGIPGWPDRAAAYAAAATGEKCPEDRRAELAWQHRCGDSKVANADLRGWNSHDVRSRLAAAGCPVTIVVGDEDFYIPTDRLAPLREELGDERVVVVEGVGHYPMVEWAEYPGFLVERAFGAGSG